MPRQPSRLFLLLVTLLPAVTATASTTTGPAEPAAFVAPPVHQGEVLLEGGLALPLGDLGAGFANTQRGMGAERGFLIGLRLNFYPERRLILSPSFHYLEFGDHDGTDALGDRFSIQALGLRYGLDLLYLVPDRGQRVRPFLGAGAAILRNKYHEIYEGEEATEYKATVHSLAWSLQMGARIGSLDVALIYEVNRFETSKLSFSGERLPYHWHSLLLRAGYTLPRF